jgi:hypothetical protein
MPRLTKKTPTLPRFTKAENARPDVLRLPDEQALEPGKMAAVTDLHKPRSGQLAGAGS